MNTAKLSSALKEHQVLALATVAGAVGVWFAVFRKSPVPIVTVTSAAPVSAGYSSADTLAAVGAGSAASLAGFQPGIDLAGRALDNSTALAYTQEQALLTLSGLFTPVPLPIYGPPTPPAPPVATQPPPTTTQPTPVSAQHVATAIGIVGVNPSTVFDLVGGNLSPHVNGIGIINAAYTVVQVSPAGQLLWQVIEGQPYAGLYIRYHDSAWSVSP